VKLPWASRFQQILSAGQITPTFHDTSSDFGDRDRRAATGLVRTAGIVVVAGVTIAGMLMV
jgi:hypothetical protein